MNWLPGMTRAKFARSTLEEIEARIAGAKFRYELQRDLATWNAIASIAKWSDDSDKPQPLSINLMLGRDPMDPDERITALRKQLEYKSPYERQIEADHAEAVRARLDQARARRREMRQ